MAKPKIVVFTTSYSPFVGGAEIAVKEIAERLRDRFDFYIVTSRFKRDLPKREAHPEGTVIRLGLGSPLDKWLLPLSALIQHHRSFASIVMGVDISMGSVAAALYKLFHPRTPFIFNIQYGYGDERLSKGRGGFIGIAFRFILGRADFVTTISTYLSDTARKYGYDGPAEIIPNGVDVEKFKVKNEKLKMKDGKIIITTSRLVPKNGIEILINAIVEVKKNMPDIQCWILGDGPEKESLKLTVKSLKLDENVLFFGSVPYDDIPKYLHEADVFVRPSRSEGMGNSFVEALAAGLPIIGTPVGGIPDIIKDGETGLFVKVDNAKDLAEKIKRLLNDKNLSEKIVENGRKMAEERFSWNKIANSYEGLFKSYIQHSVLNILIATPLMPPQLGGPALYAKNLGEEFKKMGHSVRILSFGGFLKYPSVIRHLFYLFTLAKRARRADIIFSLDYFSVGLPAAIVSRVFRVPLVLRMEGDFLWEEYVEKTRKEMTLFEFYRNPPDLSLKEKIISFISGFVIKSAVRISFSSEWRREMVINKFNIPPGKTAIIKNVFPLAANLNPKSYQLSPKKVVLWAGRMLYLKNLYRLIRAFSRANNGEYELHLVGDGPEKSRVEAFIKNENIAGVRILPSLKREELLNKFHESAFFVLPSFSDVGPNVIAESVAASIPFVMTKESGFYEYLKDAGLFINPLNEGELEEKMRILMNGERREEYKKKLEGFGLAREWHDAAEEWMGLFKSIKPRP